MTDKVFVEEAAVEFMVGTKNPSRAKLRSFLGQLADDPFNQGDFEEIDALGR